LRPGGDPASALLLDFPWEPVPSGRGNAYSSARSERSAARLAHQSGGLGVPSSILGAPTIKSIESKSFSDAGSSSAILKNGTNGTQSAEVGADSPEKVPNGVPPAFPIVVAEWSRNKRDVIRVTLDEYNGRKIVNCRTWWRNDDGDLRPGKSGLALSVRHLPALAGALAAALARARELGLIEEGGAA
jgi:hypothetical protein